MNENSNKGTTVGSLSTSDPDANQKHTYTLVDSANGRFLVNGDKIQVKPFMLRSPSATVGHLLFAYVTCVGCCFKYALLSEGGSQCVLNYEASKSHKIVVRSTDNGIPARSKDVTLTIRLRDVNDKPRNLKLSGYKLYENSNVGTVVGTLSSTDEDGGQKLSYTLSNDAGGRFAISKGNQVVRKSSTGLDYETTRSYKVTAVVQDNGNPRMTVTSKNLMLVNILYYISVFTSFLLAF